MFQDQGQGGLAKIGRTQNNGTIGAGTTTLVTGVANATGLILRRFALTSPTGSTAFLRSDANVLAVASNSFPYTYLGPGIVIPPGAALIVEGAGASNAWWVGYDVL